MKKKSILLRELIFKSQYVIEQRNSMQIEQRGIKGLRWNLIYYISMLNGSQLGEVNQQWEKKMGKQLKAWGMLTQPIGKVFSMSMFSTAGWHAWNYWAQVNPSDRGMVNRPWQREARSKWKKVKRLLRSPLEPAARTLWLNTTLIIVVHGFFE